MLRTRSFDVTYNSSNIEAIEGRAFDRIVCAGVTAAKWWANANPQEDRSRIERLIDHLGKIETDEFVLISTIDVYKDPHGVTESDPIVRDGLHAYGSHRAMLEDWVAEHFSRHRIVRLPGLFGSGLKKNAIFDLIHDNGIELINPASRYQWYPLENLADDLDRCAAADLNLINFATEPIAMGAIIDRFFPGAAVGGKASLAASYDMRSSHDNALGGGGGYMMRAPAIMDALASFLVSEGVSVR